MSFIEVVDRVIELLRSRERIAYLTLQVEFDLSDKQLAALRAELIDAKRLAVDEDGKVLVWTGDAAQMSDQQPDLKRSLLNGGAPRLENHLPRNTVQPNKACR